MTDCRPDKSKTVLCALATLFILSGCAGGQHDTRQSTALVLPPVIQYEGQFYDSLAEEFEGGKCPAHFEFGKDYVWTRDKIRIAEESLK